MDTKTNTFADIKASLFAKHNYAYDTLVEQLNDKEPVHAVSKSSYFEGLTASGYNYKLVGIYSCITNSNLTRKRPDGPMVTVNLLAYLNKGGKTYFFQLKSDQLIVNISEEAYGVLKKDFEKTIQSFKVL